MESEVEELEAKLSEAKGAAEEGAAHGTANESLTKKISLLEDELEQSDSNLKETTEKLRQTDVKAEHFERKVASLEAEVEEWEKKYEELEAKYKTAQNELEEISRSLESIWLDSLSPLTSLLFYTSPDIHSPSLPARLDTKTINAKFSKNVITNKNLFNDTADNYNKSTIVCYSLDLPNTLKKPVVLSSPQASPISPNSLFSLPSPALTINSQESIIPPLYNDDNDQQKTSDINSISTQSSPSSSSYHLVYNEKLQKINQYFRRKLNQRAILFQIIYLLIFIDHFLMSIFYLLVATNHYSKAPFNYSQHAHFETSSSSSIHIPFSSLSLSSLVLSLTRYNNYISPTLGNFTFAIPFNIIINIFIHIHILIFSIALLIGIVYW